MAKNHLKRIISPKTWKVKRKLTKFITKPNPGAHSLELGISLNVLFKDILNYCKTTKEVRSVLQDKEVLVDGKRRYDPRHVIGFMDVLSIPSINEYFRIVFDNKGRLVPINIKKNEAEQKIARINNKKSLGKNEFQLGLNDGRSIKVKDNNYKVGDSLLIKIPEQGIVQHIKLEKGNQVILVGGKHRAIVGEIEEIKGNLVTLKSEGNSIQTLKKFTFLVGDKKPLVSLSGKNE